MKLLDQREVTEDGVVHRAGGGIFFLPKLTEDELTGEIPMRVQAAMDALNDLDAATRETSRNPHLTEVGKAAKLLERRHQTLLVVSAGIEGVERYSLSIDARESRLLAVPEISPQNLVEHFTDRELRDWWRTLSKDMRVRILNEIENGPGHPRLELALLRSPYALLDVEVKVMRQAWNNGRRVASPSEAEAIALGRNQVEWGARAMAHLAAITMRIIGLQRDEALSHLLTLNKTDGVIIRIGFSEDELAKARREAERRMKSAA